MPDLQGPGTRTQLGVVVPAGTTTTQTVELTDIDASFLVVVLNVTAGGGSVTLAINGVTASGYSYPLLAPAAASGVAVTPYRIGVALTPSAQAVANDVVPRHVQVVATVSGSITYGVDFETGA